MKRFFSLLILSSIFSNAFAHNNEKNSILVFEGEQAKKICYAMALAFEVNVDKNDLRSVSVNHLSGWKLNAACDVDNSPFCGFAEGEPTHWRFRKTSDETSTEIDAKGNLTRFEDAEDKIIGPLAEKKKLDHGDCGAGHCDREYTYVRCRWRVKDNQITNPICKIKLNTY